jgi:hypothetical protein
MPDGYSQSVGCEPELLYHLLVCLAHPLGATRRLRLRRYPSKNRGGVSQKS